MENDKYPPARSGKSGMPWWLWLIIFILIIVGAYYVVNRDKAEAFTIGAGEGLAHHVSYQEAIDRAEACNLPVYIGTGVTAIPISYTAARALETETDRIKVTVPLKVGDVFGPKVGDCPARTLYR